MGQGARVAQAWVRPHDPGPGGCLQSQRTLPFQGWKDSSEPGELLLTATSPVPTIMLGAGLPGVRPRHSCPPTADGLCHSLPPPHPPHLVKASLALLTPRIAPPLPPVASETLRHRAPLSSLAPLQPRGPALWSGLRTLALAVSSAWNAFSLLSFLCRACLLVCLSDRGPHARVTLQLLTPLDLPSKQLPV